MTEQMLDLESGLEAVRAPDELWTRVESALYSEARRPGPRRARGAGWSLALAAAAVCAFAYAGAKQRQPRGLESLALSAHRAFVEHTAALDFESKDPAALRAWVSQGSERRAALQPGSSLIEMAGARILRQGRERVAAIHYRVCGQPATLLIGPAAGAAAAKRIHQRSAAGARMFSWQSRDQQYVLIASLPSLEQRACFACHAEAAMQDKILRMKFSG